MTRDVTLIGLVVWLAVVIVSLWRMRTDGWNAGWFKYDLVFATVLAVIAMLVGAGVSALRHVMGAL
jgi:uncharacterized membrane protein